MQVADPETPATSDTAPASRRLCAVAVGACALFLASMGSFDVYNFDIGYYVAKGRITVEEGRIPAPYDLLSAPPRESLYHSEKWAFEPIVYLVDHAGGPAGLVALRLLLLAATFLLLARAGSPRSGGEVLGRAWFVLLAGVTAYERFHVRPELFSFLFLAAMLFLLERHRRFGGRAVWLAPVVMALWVNFQSLFVLGLIAAGAYAGGALVGRLRPSRDTGTPPPRCRDFWLVLLLSVAATLLNPMGLDGALYPLRLFYRLRYETAWYGTSIFEFRPTFAHEPFPTLAILAYKLLLAAGGILLLSRLRKVPAAHWLILIPFLYLSFILRRNIALPALAAVPILGPQLAAWLDAACLRGGLLGRVPPAAAGLLVLTAAGLSAGFYSDAWYVAERQTRRTGWGESDQQFPRGAADFVNRQGLEGPAFTNWDAGSYLLWRCPQCAPSIDSEGDFSLSYYRRYRRVMAGVEPYADLVREQRIGFFFLRHTATDAKLLIRRLHQDPAWRLAYYDDIGCVFVGSEGPWKDLAAGAEAAPGRAFLAEGGSGRHRFPAILTARAERFSLAERHRRLGSFYGLLRRRDLERREYELALAVEPDYPEALNNLGVLAMAEGKEEEAVRLWARAVSVMPAHNSARVNLGKYYRVRAEANADPRALASAAEHLEAALEVDPENTHALMELAVVRKDEGRLRAAKDLLDRVIDIYPGHPGAHYSLGVLYRDAFGDPASAAEHFRRAAEQELPLEEER